MPSVFFEQFEQLWKRVGEKFVSESDLPFTPGNLRDLLISREIINSFTKFEPLEEKFIKHLDKSEKPPSVNLPLKIFEALDRYVGQENKGVSLEEVKKIKEKTVKEKDEAFARKEFNLTEISFLGREEELSELEDFLKSPEKRVFALYGVPMIGKTKLVSHFLENNELAQTYRTISVNLNPRPSDAEQTIKEALFGEKEFNDFSDFTSNTIIVIRNFHETLKWIGKSRELHDLKDEYKNIKSFLEEVAKNNSVKLILESRFQIHFELFLNDWRTTVKTLPNIQLVGVERDEFWEFYKSGGFSYEQFEGLCENFGNHPGLLALAFNDVEFLYQNKLIDALYEPTVTTQLLWDLIERLIDRLEKRETWILCALTFLKKPIKKEDLYEDFSTLPDFEDPVQIGDSFISLTNKLLVQRDRELYDLNPYIREVCYTFLKGRRRKQMSEIENLPYFKEFGETPYYDKVQQAQERGDYLFLLRLGQELRKEGNYKDAVKVFEASLDINPKKEVVLNELGITYKWQENWRKAIEILEKAAEKYPDNVKILNELGICYRENSELDKAIETLEKAVELENVHSYNELAICYRENNELDKAIEILEKAAEKYPDNVKILNELGICYRENSELDKAIETLEKARKKYPNDVKILSILVDVYERKGALEKAYEIARAGVRASNWKDGFLVKQFKDLEKSIKVTKHEREFIQTDSSIKLPELMGKNVVLFLSANPVGSTLRLDTEMREVENELLRGAVNRADFKLNKEVATRITDLQRRLLDDTPDFVHFSGHGSDSGIYLTDNQGNYQLVKSEALANLFDLFSDRIRCVFLNSCFSEAQANEINRFIPYVIGMKKAVPDEMAIQFAVSFYQAIAAGRDVEFAFKLAKNSIDLHNLPGSDIPVLLKR